MELAERIELLGRRWEILEKLSERKYYVNELARDLKKHPSEISKNLNELQRNGLVEHEQKEGGKLKYYHTSDYTKKIQVAIAQISEPKTEGKIEEWQIDLLVDILEDENLSEDLRLSYAKSFHRISSEYPKEVINCERAQDLFENVAKNPSEDKITEEIKRSLSAVLRGLRKEWSRWVLEKLYPIFFRNMEEKRSNEGTRLWAIKMVGQIASLDINRLIKAKARNRFLEIWFSNETHPESDLGTQLVQQLADMKSKNLFEVTRRKAIGENAKVKKKAEILLERLKECLIPE